MISPSLTFVSNCTNVICLTADGKIGINKSPNVTLDVCGNTNVDNNFSVVGCVVTDSIGRAQEVKRGTIYERDAFFETLTGGEIWFSTTHNQLQGYKPNIGWVILG